MESNATPNLARMEPLKRRISAMEAEVIKLRSRLTEDGADGQSLAQVRDAVSGMRAPVLAAELASARLMLEAANVHLEWQGMDQPPPLSAQAEAALALGLREAITNVLRHARASRVQVLLHTTGGAAELQVQDNGRGAGTRRGNGLAGMEERLLALGGQLLLTSAPGQGTLLRLQVPLAVQGAADGAAPLAQASHGAEPRPAAAAALPSP